MRVGRQQDKGDAVWNNEIKTVMLARALEDDCPMRAEGYGFADFREVWS